MKSSLMRNINNLLDKGREHDLAQALSGLHPADVADILEKLDLDDTLKMLSLLGIEQASDVLVEMSEHSRDQVAATMPIEKLTELVAEMDSDDAADIVGELSDEDADKVLAAIEPEDSREVRRLLLYEADTAGGLMQAELISALEEDTVGQVIEKIRQELDEIWELSLVFVVDDANVLRGQVSLRDLLLADRSQLIKEIMTPCYLVVKVDEKQELVAQSFQRYDVKAAPVVDSQNRLLGLISVDDIIDVVHEEADKDFYRMAGSSEEEVYSDKIFKIARLRLPWLLYNLCGGLASGWLLSYFQHSIAHAFVLVTFLPMTMSLSGAIGSQAATITVRGLALGRVMEQQIWSNIFKEFKVSLVLAVFFSITAIAVSGLWHRVPLLSLAVGCSMFAAIIISSLLGALVPSCFRMIKIDPALSSGPVVTSTNDVLSILIYLVVATLILGL